MKLPRKTPKAGPARRLELEPLSLARSLGVSMLPRLVALRRVARGRHLAEALEGIEQIKSLRPVDLQDFGAFVISARMRSQSLGVKKLTAIERRALDLVDEYRTALSGTRILNEPDLPPANLVDSFTPSSPVRFDVDPESGLGTLRPPAGGRIETPRASGDVPNALEARVPENGHVRFQTPGGGDQELPLGRRLGGGSTSEVFEHADDPNLAIRITYLRENAPAVALDDFGRRALETGAQSEFIRAVREIDSFDVASGEFRGGTVTRVTVVEKVQETAQKTIARQGGKMSVAQIMAYEGALRHLNRKGLVWLDNKMDNFAFVPKGDGSGRVEVVVMDTGGIVPVRANMDIPAPTLARDIQLIVNGEFTGQFPEFPRLKTPKFRSALRKGEIESDFADAFDYDALGIPGIEQLLFNPRSGEDFPYIAKFLEIYE